MRGRRHAIDMCSGPLTTDLLHFALPLIFSGFLQLAFNAADVIVVGKFAGDAALAAVTSNGSLINLLVGLFSGLSMGTNVLVARALGRRDYRYVEDTVHTSVALSLICGLFMAGFGFFAAPVLLRWMSCPDSVIGLSTLYLRIYFLGIPGSMIYNFASAVLHGSGDTRRPLNFLTLAGVLNVVLNLIFVIVFRMGVAGVALATLISQYFSAALVVRCLIQEMGPQHLDLKQLCLRAEIIGSIIRVGIPASMQAVVVALSNTVIQASVNSFGDVVMAGSGASASIEGFVWIGMNAFYSACLTFTSSNLGAGNYRRMDQVLLRCQIMVIGVGLTLGLLCVLLGPQLLSIYSNNPEAIAQGMLRLQVIALPYFLCGIMDVFVGALRGMGFSTPPMIVSVLGMCGFRLLWIATIFQNNRTPEVLFTSYPISWIITALVQGVCWFVVRRRVLAAAKRQEA